MRDIQHLDDFVLRLVLDRNIAGVRNFPLATLNMSKFLAYHRHRCDRFKGGGIQFAYHIWEGLTSDDTILDTVSGMSIEPQNVEVTKMHAFVPKDEHDITSTEIQKLLQKDVIRLSAPEQGEIISPIFLRGNKMGNFV